MCGPFTCDLRHLVMRSCEQEWEVKQGNGTRRLPPPSQYNVIYVTLKEIRLNGCNVSRILKLGKRRWGARWRRWRGIGKCRGWNWTCDFSTDGHDFHAEESCWKEAEIGQGINRIIEYDHFHEFVYNPRPCYVKWWERTKSWHVCIAINRLQ